MKYCDQSVSGSAREHISETNGPNFLLGPPMALQYYSALWTTSCLHRMVGDENRRRPILKMTRRVAA